MKVWIVGRVFPKDSDETYCLEWEFLGVFSTEERAIAACQDAYCFVGPILMDEPLPPTSTVAWPGAYYPLSKEG